MSDSTIPQKTCTKCGETFPATPEFFYRDKAKRDGLHAKCKACKYDAVRKHRVDSPDKHRAAGRRWYAANKERATESALRWQAANPERKREYNRAWRKANPDKVREMNRAWRGANPDKVAAINHRRRARRLAAEGTHTAEDIQKLLEFSKGKCWWCGKKLPNGEYHIDHRIPLAQGGTNNPDNLVIACPKCNASKGAKLPDEWGKRLL